MCWRFWSAERHPNPELRRHEAGQGSMNGGTSLWTRPGQAGQLKGEIVGIKDLVCKQYMRGEEAEIRDLIRLAVPDLKVGRLEERNPEESAVIFSGAPG
ncbi:MAG: hypothetical protein HDQ87_06140 [Clostridia bacterium]|nr:hypothetical protein [Clostridia bacterium]